MADDPGSAPNSQGADARQMIEQVGAEHAATWQPASTGFVPDGVSLARPGGGGAPDEPGDDDLAELITQIKARLAPAPEPSQDDRDRCASGECGGCFICWGPPIVMFSETDVVPLLAEVERLRAAAPASEDDDAHALCVPALLWEETLSAARRYREGWRADLDAMKWWAPEHLNRAAPAAMSLGERTAIEAIDNGRPAGSPPPTPAPTAPASIVERINDGWSYALPASKGDKGIWWRVQDGANNWVVPAGADSIPKEPMTEAEQIAVYGEIVRPPGTAVEVREKQP